MTPRKAPISSPAVLAIVGPTASGKSAVAGLVSRRLPCEILSADSRQIYRRMTIGTAKPTAAEMEGVTHHFVDILRPDEDYNAGRFGTDGRKVIGEILRRRRVPLVVGGSGLYLRSLVDGLFDGPDADDAVRSVLEARLKSEGAESLLAELSAVDPRAARGMHPSNTRRIIRALEVYLLTGETISALHRKPARIPFRTVRVGILWPRAVLYRRINERVVAMVNEGLVDEVRGLLSDGYSPLLRSLQTVGYREVIAHLEGSLSFSDMIALIQMNTRRFAKRQMTWFRKDPGIHWLGIGDEAEFPAAADEIVRLHGG